MIHCSKTVTAKFFQKERKKKTNIAPVYPKK